MCLNTSKDLGDGWTKLSSCIEVRDSEYYFIIDCEFTTGGNIRNSCNLERYHRLGYTFQPCEEKTIITDLKLNSTRHLSP